MRTSARIPVGFPLPNGPPGNPGLGHIPMERELRCAMRSLLMPSTATAASTMSAAAAFLNCPKLQQRRLDRLLLDVEQPRLAPSLVELPKASAASASGTLLDFEDMVLAAQQRKKSGATFAPPTSSFLANKSKSMPSLLD